MIVQEFNLNMIPDSEPVVVHVNQYDTEQGRFVIHLYNGDTPYTPSNASVLIEGRKPDGKVFAYGAANGVSISGNTVTAPCLIQMTAMEGRTRVNLIVKENGASTGTFVFWLDVQETPINQHVPASDTEIPALVALAEEQAERSEAWAVGTKNGHPVPDTDPTFENNSKYWAEQAASSVTGVASFNGRGGSVLPMAGDYNAEQITYNQTSNVNAALGDIGERLTTAESGLTNKAAKTDLTNINTTGSTNTTGATIASGTFFYLNGTLVRAKTNIASGAVYTENTNYEVVTKGGLNNLNSDIGKLSSTITGTGKTNLLTALNNLSEAELMRKKIIVNGYVTSFFYTNNAGQFLFNEFEIGTAQYATEHRIKYIQNTSVDLLEYQSNTATATTLTISNWTIFS